MMQIFISYNRKAEAITKALAKDLEELGHTIWFDQQLSGGQAWWDQILAKVRGCDLFVFVLEPEALNSTACKREYGYAVELGKPILPVLVSDGVPINRLPPALSQIQFVDYRKQDDRSVPIRLSRAIGSVPSPKPLPDPLPPPPEVPISYLGSLTARVEATSVITYEEQSALVFDLKRSLRDPENTDDARALLEKMRTRHDLFATIAEEINEVLGSVKTAETYKEPPKVPGANVANLQPDHTDTDRKPTGRERVKGACLLALIGVAVGVLSSFIVGTSDSIRRPMFDGHLLEFSFTFLPLSGVIAGAISGTNRSRIIAALVGMVVATILVKLLYLSIYPAGLLGLISVPLAILIIDYMKAYLKKQKA